MTLYVNISVSWVQTTSVSSEYANSGRSSRSSNTDKKKKTDYKVMLIQTEFYLFIFFFVNFSVKVLGFVLSFLLSRAWLFLFLLLKKKSYAWVLLSESLLWCCADYLMMKQQKTVWIDKDISTNIWFSTLPSTFNMLINVRQVRWITSYDFCQHVYNHESESNFEFKCRNM